MLQSLTVARSLPSLLPPSLTSSAASRKLLSSQTHHLAARCAQPSPNAHPIRYRLPHLHPKMTSKAEKKKKKNRRVIRSPVRVDADLETVWRILTDYEGLADFIPSLAVSQLINRGEKFARLYQDLALGLKFGAKGVLNVMREMLIVEYLPSGQRRDIEFKMVEGDFRCLKADGPLNRETRENDPDTIG